MNNIKDDIKKNYDDIRDHVRTDKKSTIKYVEVIDKYTPDDLVAVGVYCNNEYPSISKAFRPTQYWSFSDTFDQSFKNAGAIINDFSWQEENKLRTLKRVPGLFVKQINGYRMGYNAKDVNFFTLTKDTGMIMPDYNSKSISTSSAIELFGYFIPDVTGEWTFTIPGYMAQNVYSKLWIRGDYAVYDYTNKNADICNDKDREDTNIFTQANVIPPTTTFKIRLVKGDLVPIRVHVITTAGFSGSISGFITATSPDSKTVVTKSNDVNKYFVTITEDGSTPYYKKSKYFALVYDDKASANPSSRTSISVPQTNSKFFTWFMDTTPDNLNTIRALKLNPVVQYVRNMITLPITLEVSGTLETTNDVPTDITIPMGINLSIRNATWGRQNYQWTDVQQVPYTEEQRVPEQVTTKTLGNNYGTLSAHTSTLQSDPYVKIVQKIREERTPRSESQMVNVRDKAQSLTQTNKFHIDAGDYKNKFGDPTYTGRGSGLSNPGTNRLTTEFTWTKVEEKFTNKQLYINDVGILVLDYFYEGVNYISPINNISYTPNQWDPAQGKCPYKLSLVSSDDMNKAVLMIKNNGKLVGSLEIYNQTDPYPKQPNEVWKQLNVGELRPGERLIEGQNALGSVGTTGTANGLFKFSLENINCTLMYCIQPFSDINVANDQNKPAVFSLTTPRNLDNSQQMLYLYRIASRGLLGKKFLSEVNGRLGVDDMYYVPNTSNNILQHQNFEDTAGYPIITSGYNQDNYVVHSASERTKDQCQAECMSSPTCNHYFYVNGAGSDKGQCYIDKTNNTNSVYTTQNTDQTKYGAGIYSVKKDLIISSCEYNDSDSKINPDKHATFRDRTVYYQPVANQPELTYYCGLARHQQAVQNIKNDYERRDGFSNIEAFNAKCSSQSCMISNIDSLDPVVKGYSEIQDKISETYNITQAELKRNRELSEILADPKFKYNDTNALIPDVFINNTNPQPDTNIIKGQIEDMKQNMLVQNTIFTLASISAASFLIIALAIGRS